jgi:hypothetical protein
VTGFSGKNILKVMMKIGFILCFQLILSNIYCQVIEGKYENKEELKDFDTELILENGDFDLKINFYNTLVALGWPKSEEFRQSPKINYLGKGKYLVKDSIIILSFTKYPLRKKITNVEIHTEKRESDSINIDLFIDDFEQGPAFPTVFINKYKTLLPNVNGYLNLKLDKKDTLSTIRIIGEPNWQNCQLNLKNLIDSSNYFKIKVILPEPPFNEYMEKGHIKFLIRKDQCISIIDSDFRFKVNDIDFTKWIYLKKK